MNRSYLMIASDKKKHLNKLKLLKCDIAMLNLEDGVCDKSYARNLLLDTFSNIVLKSEMQNVIIRINDLHSCGKEDIRVVNILKPHAVRIPKIKTIKDVQMALNLVNDDIDIHLSIETKDGFEILSKLKIDKRIKTVYLGILDLLESLHLPQNLLTLDNPTIEYILSKFLIDSKIAGLHPVSFMYQDYKNIEEFKLWCIKFKQMGYDSCSCISPTQVNIVNAIFSINEKELQKAYHIKKVFEENKIKNITGFCDNLYGFIDEPIYKDAMLIISNSLGKNIT